VGSSPLAHSISGLCQKNPNCDRRVTFRHNLKSWIVVSMERSVMVSDNTQLIYAPSIGQDTSLHFAPALKII